MDTRLFDARDLSNNLMEVLADHIKEAKDSLGEDINPKLGIVRTDGSSDQFIKSINNKCSQLGIEVNDYYIGLDRYDSRYKKIYEDNNDYYLYEEGFLDNDGAILVRPPYNPDNELLVELAIDDLLDNTPELYDVDRMKYSPSESMYPPVVESVLEMLGEYWEWSDINQKHSKAVMIGNSPYVGNPAVTAMSRFFGEVVQLRRSSSPELISRQVKDADIIVTYRDMDDISFNKNAFVIDLGDDSFYDKHKDEVLACTKHIGQLTTTRVLVNLVNNYLYFKGLGDWR